MKDYIAKTIFRYVLVFVMMYGFYVIFHGHLSPGGGFAGGTVLGLGVLLFFLIFGPTWRKRLGNIPLDVAVVLITIGSLMEGIKYLLPVHKGPVGEVGTLFSVGIISVVNLGIGLLVASTIISIYYLLSGED